MVEGFVEGGCPRVVVPLTHVTRTKNRSASTRLSGKQAKCNLDLLADANS